MNMKNLKPTDKLFTGWQHLDEYRTIRLSLGCNPVCAREASGDPSGVLCVVTPQYKNGSFKGTVSHPGLVVKFAFDALLRTGFSRRAIYFSEGANLGTRRDPARHGAPVCEECILAGESSLKGYSRIPHSVTPCWSCCEMLDENRNETR